MVPFQTLGQNPMSRKSADNPIAHLQPIAAKIVGGSLYRIAFGFITIIVFIGALAGAVLLAANPPDAALSGVVVDAVTGRVAAGASVTYKGRILRRFVSKAFSFADDPPGDPALTVQAPGYQSVTREMSAGQHQVRIELKPEYVPGLSGVVVFPAQKGSDLNLSVQLLDAAGRAMSEYPGVAFAAHLAIIAADDSTVGVVDLQPRLDFSGPDIRFDLVAKVPAMARAANPNGAYFTVNLEAGGAKVTSRRFSLPPDAMPGHTPQ